VTSVENDDQVNFEQADCALLFGSGPWRDKEAVPLLMEEVVPMAAPALADRCAGLSPDMLLAGGPLIHLVDAEDRWFDWRDWKEMYAPNGPEMDRSVSVSNYGLAIHQAVRGDGVVLAWSGLMAELRESGALVIVQDRPLVSDRAYWLVAKPGFLASPIGRSIQKIFKSSPE